MSYGKISVVAISLSLISCANVPSSSSQYSMQNYKELISLKSELSIKIPDDKKTPQQEILKKENKIRPIAEKKCLVPYQNTLNKILTSSKANEQPTSEAKLRELKTALNNIHKKSIELDSSLPNCLKPLGVSGEVRYNYRGHSYTTQEYFQMVMVRTDQIVSLYGRQNNQTYTPTKPIKSEAQISNEILQQQILINKRLLATIEAEKQMANSPPGSAAWVERQLFGNPYSKGRQDLIEQSKQLAAAQENLRRAQEDMQRLNSMSTGNYNYGTNCFSVRPYYRKDGTYVRGHMRCK